MGFPIFLSSGGRTKRVQWSGKTFEDLAKVYFKVFCLDHDDSLEENKMRRGHFYLKHVEYGVPYEGFELNELVPGCLVEIRGPHALKHGAHSWEVDPDVTGSVLSLESDEDCETDEDVNDANGLLDFELDADGFQHGAGHDYDNPKTLREKIWKTMDDPAYSWVAKSTTIFVMLTILVSTAVFTVETMPAFNETYNSKNSLFYIIETVCIAIFTVELLLRVATAPPHLISFCPFNMSFFRDLMNVIDILAILPYYIELGLDGTSVPGLAILRVIRLIRVFRLFKVSKGALVIFLVTMKKSAKPLYMLIFFTALAVIIFSSLMYYAERGTYDTDLHVWRRKLEYRCAVSVSVIDPTASQVTEAGNEQSPTEVAVQDTAAYYDGGQQWLEQLMEKELAGAFCERVELQRRSTQLSCPLQYGYEYEADARVDFEGRTLYYRTHKSNCQPVYEVSPFQSIPATMWWCVVTMTTVGYGDIYPIQWYGRMLGMVVMLSGILVIALPITVIGSNFADVYRHMVGVSQEHAQHERAERAGDGLQGNNNNAVGRVETGAVGGGAAGASDNRAENRRESE